MTRVIGYVRVSTGEQADSGAGLQAQRDRITAECQRREWELVSVFEDAGLSGKSTNRPGFEAAIDFLRDRAAEGIVVSNLDRLTRSLTDFANLMETARTEKWNLVALDLGVDLSTPAGEFLAHVMASVAQWERRIISQRTKSALTVKKSQGIKLGGPSKTTAETKELIRARREAGESLAAIAKLLNEQGIPTGRNGAKWYPSSVSAVFNSTEAPPDDGALAARAAAAAKAAKKERERVEQAEARQPVYTDPAQIPGVQVGMGAPKNAQCKHCGEKFAGPKRAIVCPECKAAGHADDPHGCGECFNRDGPG